METNSKAGGVRRGFYHTSAAWYGKTIQLPDRAVDEVMVGLYPEDGGTNGEFSVKWYELAGKATPKLEVYDDAWAALAQFRDLLDAMADVAGKDITPHELCYILIECGMADLTERVAPGDPKPASVQSQLVAALKASPHVLHTLSGGEQCKCSQCDFVRERDAALSAAGAA